MSKIIEIVVSPNGETQLETKGFVGEACKEASRFVEQALGSRQSERLTAEFHQNHENKQVNEQRT